MSDQGLFTEFMREERGLSNHLQVRREPRGLLQEIRTARSLDQLEAIDAGLDQRLAELLPVYPQLGPLQAATVDEQGGELRPIGEGMRVATTRFWVKFPVTGDFEMLRYWPDRSEKPLRSVHHQLMERIGGYANLASCSDDDAKEYWRLQPTWQLHLVDLDDGPWALYTFVDLTPEEEDALADSGGLEPVVRERCQEMAAIVGEIVAQARNYFEIELPELARAILAGRRQVLTNRTELLKDLTVPPDWSGAPLELEEAAVEVPPIEMPPDEVENLDPSGDVVGETERSPTDGADVAGGDGASSFNLDLREMSYRLSPKSFAEVLGTIRTWADAVERNPRGFGHLDEDSISDLLAATLNATMPHAGREVFSRSGKVDIHVSANVLAEGSGPAEVFLCESKFADTQEKVREALEDQIFRYLTARSTQAVLLALCRQQEFTVGEGSTREWAAQAAGFTGASDGPVSAWPHHTYRVGGRSVEVCIATVAVPRTTTRAGKRK